MDYRFKIDRMMIFPQIDLMSNQKCYLQKKTFTGWFCSAQTFQIVIQVKSRDKLLTIVWLGNSLCSFLHRSLHHWIIMFIFVSLIVGFTRLYIYTIDYIL